MDIQGHQRIGCNELRLTAKHMLFALTLLFASVLHVGGFLDLQMTLVHPLDVKDVKDRSQCVVMGATHSPAAVSLEGHDKTDQQLSHNPDFKTSDDCTELMNPIRSNIKDVFVVLFSVEIRSKYVLSQCMTNRI